MMTAATLSDRNQRRVDVFWNRVHDLPDGFPATVRTMITRLRTVPPEYAQLRDILHTIDPHLLLEFGVPPSDNSHLRPEVVISADGVEEVFPIVFAIVDRAPTSVTDRWNIRALRPGHGTIPNGILHDGITGTDWSMADIRFTATPSNRHLKVTLYVPGLSDRPDAANPSDADIMSAVLNGLDHALGEYAVTTDLTITFQPLTRLTMNAEPLPALLTMYDQYVARSTTHDD